VRAGAARIVGGPVMIKISSQKDRGRHPLHRATRRVDDHLHRRTRAGNPAHLCASARLVLQWSPHQSVPGVQSWRGEGLGVWRVTRL
jgi:hypothetical protein